MQIVSLIVIALNVWMLIDAARRRAEFWWFLVIIFLPFGALVYFFMVKLQDYDLSGLRRVFSVGAGPASITKLSYRAQETPSVSNKLALAEALSGAERYTEAADVYREVLRKDADNKQSLHGLARSLLGAGKSQEACEHLQRLLEIDNAYGDYSAALDYAEALWQSGQREDAIELLHGLVGVSSRINHRVALAHYLAQAERTGPARDVLDQALRDYEHSPSFVKRRDQKWADRAGKMLRELG